MSIACRGLKVKIMGQANAVDPTFIEGSFSSYHLLADNICILLISIAPAADWKRQGFVLPGNWSLYI